MQRDSFIVSSHKPTDIYRQWLRWALTLFIVFLASISGLYFHAWQRYRSLEKKCALCEQKTLNNEESQTKDVAKKYTLIIEQATAVQSHLESKNNFAHFAQKLLRNLPENMTLQSASCDDHNYQLLFNLPKAVTLSTLTHYLNQSYGDFPFQFTHIEQKNDALVVTCNAHLFPKNSETKKG